MSRADGPHRSLSNRLRYALARGNARYFRGKRSALAGNREYDPERFEDLVLFIVWTMRDDPDFGRTKLAKALFYVDFDAYAGEGESLTGSTYEHWDHGPFPPQLYDVERKLVRERRAMLTDPDGPGDTARLVPTAEPSPRQPFEEWVKLFVAKRARELAREPSWHVEDASHRHRGWELTTDGEPIPYATHFIPTVREPLPKESFEWARQVVRDYERATKPGA